MNWQTKVFAAFVFAVVSFSSGQTALQSDIEQVKTVDKQYQHAVLHGDTETLYRIFADDCQIVHGSGFVGSAADLVKSIQARDIVFDSYEHDDISIRFSGTAAILVTRNHKGWTGKKTGKHVEDTVGTFIYERKAKEWKLIFVQNTPIVN